MDGWEEKKKDEGDGGLRSSLGSNVQVSGDFLEIDLFDVC